VHKCTLLMGTDESSIKLIPAGSSSPDTIFSDPHFPEAGAHSWPRNLKESVMGYLGLKGELDTKDLQSDERFPALHDQSLPARALLAAALKVDGRVTGMLTTSNHKPGRKWTDYDRQLLAIIASHSAGVIEKARLRVEAEVKRRLELEREAMDRELALAHSIQMGIVPRAPLDVAHWRIEGRMSPALQVGGDFFDYFVLDGDRAAIVIADVEGKGIPAALFVFSVQSALRAFAGVGLGPLDVVRQLDRTVRRSNSERKFVTLFYAELDHARGRMRYVNAGHMYPRLRHADGCMEQLGANGGLPLGLDLSVIIPYSEQEIAIAPDDAVLFYSDGLWDAESARREPFEEARLDAAWARCTDGGSCPPVDQVMAAVRDHRGTKAQVDDETALVIWPRHG